MSIEQMTALLEDQKKAFHDFKEFVNTEIKEIKAKGVADPTSTAKVEKANDEIAKLQKSMDELQLKMQRPGAPSGGSEKDQVKAEHKTAYLDGFIRKGRKDGLRDLELKAMNVTTDSDGGFAVPEELDRNILSLMRIASPMRSVCNVITVGTPDYKKIVNKHGASSGWVGESDARPETNTPSLSEIVPFMGEIYANAYATQTMLEDAFFNVEQFLNDELTQQFAIDEGTAFTTGNGTKKPKGFLAYTQAATVDGTRAFGQIQYLPTGVSGAFKTASTTVSPNDDLIDLVYEMKAPLRTGASYMMAGRTLGRIRKWKDQDGNFVWQPAMVAAQPSMLNGYPVVENEDMPGIGSGTVPIAFGNWKRAYYIVDRIGIMTLRDPYTADPYVKFKMRKRVGGMLVDSEAIKVLKLSAS